MAVSSYITNQRGIALLYLVIFFTLLGVLVTAGVKMFGSRVNLAKINDTKAEFERDVQMITAWAAKNGRLPIPNSVEYASIFGSTPVDAWGRQIVYKSDADLATTVCGRASVTGQEVAFLLISGGDDMIINSTAAAISNGELSGVTAADLYQDLYRSVSLKELRAQVGCDGSTRGDLKILNNELPNACAGNSVYSATLFPDGGVPAYSWDLPTQSSAPWATIQIGAGTGLLSPGTNTRITARPGIYPVTARLTDSKGSVVQRVYSIKVGILGSCANACAADLLLLPITCPAACAADTTPLTGCKAICAANPACVAACPDCVL